MPKESPQLLKLSNSDGYDTSQIMDRYDLVYNPFIVQILPICNPYRPALIFNISPCFGYLLGVDKHPYGRPLTTSLSLPYPPKVGPTWDSIGVRAPMHVRRA